MTIAAVIVAAGRGKRAGSRPPKQYRMLGGEPVLTRTIRAFLDHQAITALQVVIHPDDADAYRAAVSGLEDPRLLTPVPGGEARQASVRDGLQALEGQAPHRVLIHDAARPFVSAGVIDRVIEALEAAPAAFPALPIVDALWTAKDGLVTASVARENLWRAQTPQGFSYPAILAAHRDADPDAPDDVSVARAAGLDVAVVLGDGNNFKITLAEDFARAERLLGETMDFRVGHGFDVHAFEDGDHVVLCGVRVPFDKALRGHSDADVAMHAMTDALFGALAEGDIGRWFPPSDPQWKAAASSIFLEKAIERVAARGFRVTALDCTIICEAPKIGPLAEAMTTSISRITGLPAERISIKATTSEKLGFTGRGEGIAAMATASLMAQ